MDFVLAVRKRMQLLNLDAKVLLILDIPGHSHILCSDDKKMVVIPPNVILLVQSMHHNVIQEVKL